MISQFFGSFSEWIYVYTICTFRSVNFFQIRWRYNRFCTAKKTVVHISYRRSELRRRGNTSADELGGVSFSHKSELPIVHIDELAGFDVLGVVHASGCNVTHLTLREFQHWTVRKGVRSLNLTNKYGRKMKCQNQRSDHLTPTFYSFYSL